MRRVLIVLLGCIAVQTIGASAQASVAEEQKKDLFPPGFPFTEPRGEAQAAEEPDEEEAPSEETEHVQSSERSSASEKQEPAGEGTGSSAGPSQRVSSTAYCHTGVMASGKRAYEGAAAMNGAPFGRRYRVLDGPRAGETFVVEDRIGGGSTFDIAYPGNCEAARLYGRRTISIRRVW